MGGEGDGRGGRVLLKIYNALPDEFIRLYIYMDIYKSTFKLHYCMYMYKV